MSEAAIKPKTVTELIKREAATFLLLLFFGLALMPFAIYFVGQTVFGAFEGNGLSEFFGSVSARFREFDAAAWFLVLSPYLIWQLARFSWRGWRHLGKSSR